jgi:DNA topoisomerase-2
MDQVEHILKRPDTYIGSTEMSEAELWVMAPDDKHFELRTIQYVPGLYKIFDEILVNAADNYQRDSSMDTLRVVIDERM